MQNNHRRSGFTLTEVLVTVAIMAVLAAIAVPIVTRQLGKGDAPGFNSSVNSVRTSITAFATDTRRIPRRFDQLNVPIVVGDSDIVGTAYTAKTTGLWRGPYTSFNVAPGDSVPFGIGTYAQDTLKDSSNFVIVHLGGITKDVDAVRLDSMVDNADGNTKGTLRWTVASGNVTGRLSLLLMSSR